MVLLRRVPDGIDAAFEGRTQQVIGGWVGAIAEDPSLTGSLVSLPLKRISTSTDLRLHPAALALRE